MNISYNWLNKYLKLEISVEEIATLLTDIGLEVEKIKEVESIKGGLKGIVIGKVLTKNQHPNADRLAITTVDVGGKSPLQIICGAPNVKVGQKVPVAMIGTILYDGEESFKIKKSKIRGELSNGMICGPDEIGLGEKTDGIMILDASAKVGTTAAQHFQLESDIVFEIGLTPNRSDAMGHIGVARDLMTVLNHKGHNLKICMPSVENYQHKENNKNISVVIDDYALCPRYSGVSISGIKVADSPQWLQKQLKSIGVSPINNVVDVTNYVLHELGQPLHAFDIAKINGNKIIVSTIKEKTKFTTLDNVERELSSNDLIINNENKPMCIAGVYGGIDSGVSEKTKDLFLESAYFNPVSIRKTSKRHSLSTDASFRYERGCDPNITVYALKRAALLITEICGGNIASDIIDIYPKKIDHYSVNLSYERMDKLIGEVINRKYVKQILNNLDIDIVKSTKEGLSLRIPPFRSDVKREVDVIEEILRIYGFNNIKIPEKLNTSIFYNTDLNSEKIKNIISDLLSNMGFNETINNSLTKSQYTSLISELGKEECIQLLNPLSQDLNVMRKTLIFNGLENINYNLNRKNSNIKLYEFGRTYHKQQESYLEKEHLQILVSGNIKSENWNANPEKVNIFFIKEKVEHILCKLGIKDYTLDELKHSSMTYSLCYKYNKKNIVNFGKVSRDLCAHFDIETDVFIADFNLDVLLELTQYNNVQYQEISKFPEIRRDLSLLIDKSISFGELKKIAMQTENKILKSINLFDVYEGNKLPEEKKSYALSFIMADNTKTLTDKQADKIIAKIIKNLKDQVGAEVR